MITSYCPDGSAAAELVLASKAPARVFYDLDTPVTLERLEAGEWPAYLPPSGLGGFDLVLSYTGGEVLSKLQLLLGAVRVSPLYGSVDPDAHHPVDPVSDYRSELSYLGTFARDRQQALDRFFVEPARMLPECRFVLGGALYPADFPWTDNIFFVRHMPPPQHPAFFSSSRVTLNITRQAMATMGWCPSGRLFEAAACGAPILTDWWDGLEAFYAPGTEVFVARSTEDSLAVLGLTDAELRGAAKRARERTLQEHTADRRVLQLEAALESIACPLSTGG